MLRKSEWRPRERRTSVRHRQSEEWIFRNEQTNKQSYSLEPIFILRFCSVHTGHNIDAISRFVEQWSREHLNFYCTEF